MSSNRLFMPILDLSNQSPAILVLAKYALLAMLSLLISACTRTAEPTAITASIQPLAMVASELTKNTSISCCGIVASAEQYHHSSLAPSQVSAMKKAQVLLLVGNENYAQKAKQLVHDDARLLSLADEVVAGQVATVEHGSGDADHKLTGATAHAWLNPQRMLIFAERLTNILSKDFPQQAAQLSKNMTEFRSDLLASDATIAQILQPFTESQRHIRLIEVHKVLPEFASYYGVEIFAAIRDENDRAMSSKAFSALARQVSQSPEKYCLVSSEHDANEAVQMSEKLGARSVTYPLFSPSNSPVTYSKYLQTIAERLRSCAI